MATAARPMAHELLTVGGALALLAGFSWVALLAGDPVRAAADAGMFLSMWLWMVGGSMLPTVAPMVSGAVALLRPLPASVRAARATAFLAPYLALWAGVGVLALGIAQVAEGRPPVAAGLVALAGLYELGILKERCLAACRAPIGFFLRHGTPDALGSALALGIRHATLCLGCCAGLMLALTAAGAFHPLWMVALGVLVLLEKTHARGQTLGRAVGVALLLAAPLILITSRTMS